MILHNICCRALTVVWIVSTGISVADELAIDYTADVQPILVKHCISCHGSRDPASGLSLVHRESALSELDSGMFAIAPGRTQDSELLRRISTINESERMPPEGEPLSAEQISVLHNWIEQGAEWPTHWAFRAPVVIRPPQVDNSDWNINPIDAFIYARLATAGLQPNPLADRRTLIRRATYDLLGLPPKPDEVEAFVTDSRIDAYERLIDRLLDSPHYGERWARHWLDLVRYGETNSYERDAPKPNAWKYRDYVIRSFNEDKPFSQFALEQLAGEQLEQVSDETITATGFYRIGAWDDAAPDKLKARYDELDDILTTVGQVFLGVTINCARCHDHKIDPISQADYYRMLAFFADIPPYGKSKNIETDVSAPAVKQRYAALGDLLQSLEAEIRVIEQRGIEKMSAADQRSAKGRSRRAVLKKLKDYLDEKDWRLRESLLKPKREVTRQIKNFPARDTILSVARVDPTPPQMHVLARGNPRSPMQAVDPGLPVLFRLGLPLPSVDTIIPEINDRLSLAKWIASPQNYMTTRVIANRIWQYHFGRGIVRSSNNFGQLGTPPTHPHLLDWLARYLVNSDWKLKTLHRLIMTSRTYQMSSADNSQGLALDPDNNFFWRFDMRRLSAEEVRDSLLAVNQSLNRQVYGPSFFEKLSPEVLASQSQPGKGWGDSSPTECNRRSIYIHVKRSLISPLLCAFDFPDPDSSCEARFLTLQPSQALALLNGEFAHEQAKQLGQIISAKSEDVDRQITEAIRLVFARQPNSSELKEGESLIHRLVTTHKLSRKSAIDLYCLSLLNWNEFIFVD